MEDMKKQIELKLIATQISDWCRHQPGLIYDASLCSQERCIRFQTPLLQRVFHNADGKAGAWKNGRFLMYEMYNEEANFRITCSVSLTGLQKRRSKDCLKLIESCKAKDQGNGIYYLRSWEYPNADRNLSVVMEAIHDFSELEMPYFETELAKWLDNKEYVIKNFPISNYDLVKNIDMPEELYIEGGMRDILSNRYERNLAARKKCIAVHGTACKVCGFDFGVAYGDEHAGKIHVHHKTPLSEIREDYMVDPVNDLVPVCPNCHMIIHSKENGVYTIEEMLEKVKPIG